MSSNMTQEFNKSASVFYFDLVSAALPSEWNATAAWRRNASRSNMYNSPGNTNIRHDGTDLELTPGKVVFVVVMLILNFFMLLGNTISIVTIARSRVLRERTYYWLVLNLAIVDLLNSLSVVPVNTVWELYGVWPLSAGLCHVTICADLAFSAISSYSTVLVSIDKYLSITKPFLYDRISAPRVVLGSISAVWIVWFSFSIASVYGDFARNDNLNETIYNGLDTCNFVMTDIYTIVSALVTFFIPFIILLFTSVKILCVARKHICRIAANHSVGSQLALADANRLRRATRVETTTTRVETMATQASVWNTSSSLNTSSSAVDRDQPKMSRRKFSQAKTCQAFGTVTIVIVFFIMMFAPYWFAAIVDVGCSCIHADIYEDYLSVFYYMHSLVNPYIYMATDRRYKKELRRLCGVKHRQKHSPMKNVSWADEER